MPCHLGLWCWIWNGFEQHWPELLGSFCSFHHLCGLQWQTAWKDHNPSIPLDLGRGGNRVSGWSHPAERSSKLRRAPSHWLLEQSWIRLLFSQCLLLCRCCLRSWLHDFGTGTSENTSGYLHYHSGQEGKIPLVFTQQYCLDLLPTSVVLKLICRSASTQHWIRTSGLFHAVTLAASSVWGPCKSFRRFGERWN